MHIAMVCRPGRSNGAVRGAQAGLHCAVSAINFSRACREPIDTAISTLIVITNIMVQLDATQDVANATRFVASHPATPPLGPGSSHKSGPLHGLTRVNNPRHH